MEVSLKTFRPQEVSGLFAGRRDGFHIMRKEDNVDYRNWKETLDKAMLKPVSLEYVLEKLMREDFRFVRYRMQGLAFYVVGGDGNSSIINYNDTKTRGIFRMLTDRRGSIVKIRKVDDRKVENPEHMIFINGNDTRPIVLRIIEDNPRYRFALTDDSVMPSIVNCLVGVPKIEESRAKIIDLLRKQ